MLSSLIWACALGLAVGNYATSFVFRLPRNESPFTKHPYCGGCGTMLAPKDLFPAVSWLLLKGRCRYCDMVIPPVFFWMEVFCALIFMLGVVGYGYSEPYMLVVAAGTVLVTLWALELREQRIYYSLLLLVAALGLVYRTLLDATLFDALYGMFWGAGIPLVLWRARMDKGNTTGEKQRLQVPPSVALGATAGIWLASFGLLLFIPLWGVALLLYRLAAKRYASWPEKMLTPAFSMALLAFILNPQIMVAAQEWAIVTLRAALGISV